MSSLPQYNGDLLSRQADLITQGQFEGSQLRPPSDATKPDINEAELHSHGQKWIGSAASMLSGELTELSKTASELHQKLLALKGRMEQLLADNSLTSAVAADMADERQSLVVATEARMKAQVDLRAFRAKHFITEPARYPESRIWHFAIIAVLALLETMMNSFFYENAQGLLGGFAVALGVAIVNMGGALVLGMLFRYKNVQDKDKRIGGWASLVAFAVLTVYCNALFAAFRAEYQLLTDPTNASQLRQAFRAAAEGASQVFVFGMTFGDFMSFILFGIGLLLSCFAFYKGYTFDDVYPGHGPKDRLVRDALRQELALQEKLRQKVKDLLNRRRQEVQAMLHEPMQLANAAGARLANLDHVCSRYFSTQNDIQRDYSLMLSSYRDANTAIRTTSPPSYFGVTPDLRVPLPDGEVAAVREGLSAAQQAASALHFHNQASLNQKLNDLQLHSARILDETIAEFLRSVERAAEANINKHIQSIHSNTLITTNA